MNTEDNSNNIDCDEKTSPKTEENTNKETENNPNDLGIYKNKNGTLSFFPDANFDEKKAGKNNNSKTKNTDIMNTLETLLKKVEQLQRDVNQLMKKGIPATEKNSDEILKALLLNLPNITSIEKNKNDISKDENSAAHKFDIFEEFLSIYNSPNLKKSISINKELEAKVKELVSKHYGITDNDSKIINTALMIALLKIK